MSYSATSTSTLRRVTRIMLIQSTNYSSKIAVFSLVVYDEVRWQHPVLVFDFSLV